MKKKKNTNKIPRVANMYNFGGKWGETDTWQGALTSSLGSVTGELFNIGLGQGLTDNTVGKVGEGITKVGGTVGKALSAIPGVGPLVGALVEAGSGLIGGTATGLWGADFNEEAIADIKNQNKQMANTIVASGSNSDIMAQWANQEWGDNFTKSDLGKEGWGSNAVTDKYNVLKKEQQAAQNKILSSYDNAIENTEKQSTLNMLANYTALGGPIHINPSKRGTFTAAASRHNMGVQEFARKVLANKDKYSTAMVKKANFARNAAGWKHDNGGPMIEKVGDTYYIPEVTVTPEPWQLEFRDNFGDLEFRNRLYNTIKSRTKINDDHEVDNVLHRLYKVWEAADKPKIKVKDPKDFKKSFFIKRPHYNPITNSVGNIHSYQNLVAELAHPIQMEFGEQAGLLELLSDYPKALLFEVSGHKTDNPYRNKDHYEYETHEIIEPALHDYILYNKRSDNKKAEGGFLTHGGVFSNGITVINNGNSHEENPYGGVQMGVDPQGIPNLVEEDEVIWNDYVFSDRLKTSKEIRSKYKMRESKEMSFADMAKKLSKESEERPNDPISKRGLEANLMQLAMEQEALKMKKGKNKTGNKFYTGGPYETFNIDTYKIPTRRRREIDTSDIDSIDFDNFVLPEQVEITNPEFTGFGTTGYDSKVHRNMMLDWDKDKNPFASYLRYAPLIGNITGIAQNLLSKPDYSASDRLNKAAADLSTTPRIGYTPLGDYMGYTPVDTNIMTNKLAAESAGLRNAIINSSSPSRTSALLAADYNAQNALGDAYLKAAEQNLARKQAAATFNRGTNQANAEMGLKSSIANAELAQKAKQLGLSATLSAIQSRDAVDAARNAALNTNINQLMTGLGNIGREQTLVDMISKMDLKDAKSKEILELLSLFGG